MQNNTDAALELYELCRPCKVVSIIGLSKSSGKTAALRSLINVYRQSSGNAPPLAVTSVGLGGEIRLFKGMYAATAAGSLSESDYTRLIMHTTGMNTPLGEVIVTEALSNGRVNLAGPSINSQLSALCGYFFTELSAGQVIIDGAGDKRTFAADSDGVILCAGAAFSRDMRAVVCECVHLCRLMELPPVSKLIHEDAVLINIPGALTDEILQEASNSAEIKRTAVITADSSKIFVKPDTLDRFLYRGGAIFVEKPANLVAVTLNPAAPGYAFDRAAFFDTVIESVTVPVFDLENIT